MAREITSLFTLNRGVVSRLGLARADVKRLAMAAQVQTNWMPRVLGSASLRAGLGYLSSTKGNNPTRNLPFVFATDDTALLELTGTYLRVWINDVLLTRPSVATTITNAYFTTDLSGWTSYDGAGSTSSWAAFGNMQFVGNVTTRAVREQHVTCSTPNVEHGIRVVINDGPVSIRIGSTSGADDYLSEANLNTGTHSLSIVPTGDFYIRFFSYEKRKTSVQSCDIEVAGVVTVPTPWNTVDLPNIRSCQSADVVFVACIGFQQRRIERRGTHPNARSWSVCLYSPTDGPFKIQNTGPVTLTPSVLSGNGTLTSSQPLFKTKHVGALFSHTSVGQNVSVTAGAANTWSNSIRITGLTANRGFAYVVSGTFVGRVKLQVSYDNLTWLDVVGYSWTAPTSSYYNDSKDNVIAYYRIGIDVGDYTSGTAIGGLTTTQGSIRGIGRVTGYTDSTHVNVEVLTDFGTTTASTIWEEGEWSDKAGWPTSMNIHEGRMWQAGQNGIWGSISDAYDAFDETYVGDAGSINRTIGSGPVDTVNWILSLKGMVMGSAAGEHSVRASSLDEPVTPTTFNIKTPSTQGSGPVEAVKCDGTGYFVNRSTTKVYDLSFDLRAYDYFATDLMELAPELGYPGITRLAIQRLPDTRIHAVRSDGTALVGVINKSEDVLAWIPVTTQGQIVDVCVLPAKTGDLDDQVYYTVKRTLGSGGTGYYLEKWAQEIDCRGDKALCKLADAFITYTGAPATVITGLGHLEGLQVVVWADGADVGTNDTVLPWTQNYTVSGGQITLAVAASNVVVGLPYTAQFKSAKIGSQMQGVSPLNKQKKIGHIGLILADSHPRGVRYGPAFDDASISYYMDDMPLIEDGIEIGTATETDYDQNLIEFPGTWTTDLRICLQAQAPRPCTVLAVTLDLESNA